MASEKKAALEQKKNLTKASTSGLKASTISSKAKASSSNTRNRKMTFESSDDEERLCSICNLNYYKQTVQMQGKWAGCDTCDSWFCQKCLPINFNYKGTFNCDNYFVNM